jgi:hypothetical protein
VGGMAGELLHDMELICAGRPTNGRIEFDTADHLTRCTGGSDVVLVVS